AGHRTMVAWQDLRVRAGLPMDDPAYISPRAVQELKDKKKGKGNGITASGSSVAGGASAARTNAMISRTAFERNRQQGNPSQDANAEDPGIVELHEVYIRLVPADNDLYEGDESVIFQALVANQSVVLAVNEAPNKHEQFPYAVAEGRP